MAKAVITIEDAPDGDITVKVDFDPPADGDNEGTPAQQAAVFLLQKLTDAISN